MNEWADARDHDDCGQARTDRHEHDTEECERVGYRRPPVKHRFKPGQSGNPQGRAKGSQNLKTLFQKILKEPVSLREGARVRKVTKAEAILRGLVLGAMKGDAKNLVTLFRLAEQTGQFQEGPTGITEIRRVIVSWKSDDSADPAPPVGIIEADR